MGYVSFLRRVTNIPPVGSWEFSSSQLAERPAWMGYVMLVPRRVSSHEKGDGSVPTVMVMLVIFGG